MAVLFKYLKCIGNQTFSRTLKILYTFVDQFIDVFL